MRKPTLYVSGPMSGLPELNYPEFFAAADRLRSLGFYVLNPADHGPGGTWRECLARDLTILVHCHAVVVLDGWEKSKGARLECHVATELGMGIYRLGDVLSTHGGAIPDLPQPIGA